MKPTLICVCVFIIATLVYLNTLDCGFCFDDLSAIEQNQDLRPTTPWTNLWWDDFWGTPMNKDGSHKSYRPLCVLLFRFNYYLHQLDPMGYHLGNVVLHAIASTLFTLFCYLYVFHAAPPAMIAGLLFAVHPVHSEAVAGVVGRAESLSAIFFIASICAYQNAIQKAQGTGIKWLLLTIVAGLCAVLSKEQGITFVALCVVSDVVVNGTSKLRNTILRGFCLFLFVITFMIARVKIMSAELPVFTIHDNPAVGLPTPHRQLTWLYLCYVNMQLLFFPSWLCADWTMGTVPVVQSLADPRNLATLATFLGLAVLSLHALFRACTNGWRIISMGLSLLVFPFLPASNLFFPVGFVVAERILYVPSMGFCILASYGMSIIINYKPKLRMIVVIALTHILIFYSIKTIVRNRDWLSDETLFTVAVKMNPNNGKIHNNLGHVYENSGRLSEAEQMFLLASQIQPDDVGAFINLGRVRKAQDKYQLAEEAYNEAVKLMPDIKKQKTFRIAPNYINLYFNLANLVKLNDSRLEEALQLYNTALSMKQDFVEVYINKADTLLKLNKIEEAKLAYEKAIYYNPKYTDAYYNLGTVYIRLKDNKQAEKYFRHAVKLNPGHIASLFNLALLLKDSKNWEESETIFLQLIQLAPSDWRVTYNLGILYTDTSQLEKAEQWFKKTLELNHSHQGTAYVLGLLYSTRNEYNTAIEYLKKIPTSNVKAMLLLGDCYTNVKQLRLAEKTYSAVLSHSPNHTMAMHNLAVVMAEQKQYTEAIKLFSAVLELEPTHKTASKFLMLAKQQLAEQQK